MIRSTKILEKLKDICRRQQRNLPIAYIDAFMLILLISKINKIG